MKYAVSHISWHENDLTTRFVEAESELAALQAELFRLNITGNLPEHEPVPITIHDCKSLAFDCDCMINATEIPE
jgi:hypothetical protein